MDEYTAWADVPDHLKTKTQLGELGLKPAKDQKPIAKFCSYIRGRGRPNNYILYDVNEAAPKRKLSKKQEAALAEARRKAMTTTCCNKFVGVINWRFEGGMCASCYAAWEGQKHMDFLERSEARASEWARGVLADERAVILDTETTELWGEIVELAIIGVNGETIFNKLIKPNDPITPGAQSIHGISDEDVEHAPTFDQYYPRIKEILEGASRVIVYNADYDQGRLMHNCSILELDMLTCKFECAMEEYARWWGDWSDYHNSFKWQRLDGGHRALGDCLACLEKIKEMAENELA